jgi:cytoskeletal protein CcmA (bactofilin family)
VVISDKARVTGMVKAAHVIINGTVTGPVESGTLLELQPSARVSGSVRYELLEMHPGALIDGELRPLKNADKPTLKLAASNEH